MKVLNIHKRVISKPKDALVDIFATLATPDDKLWPGEKWPRIRFKNGVAVGSEGGHGPIRYKILEYNPQRSIEFEFQKPAGFNGTHKFEIAPLDSNTTEIKHVVAMHTSGMATLYWVVVFRWLHDALIEDAFDKVENHLTHTAKKSTWSLWVKLCRRLLKRKNSS